MRITSTINPELFVEVIEASRPTTGADDIVTLHCHYPLIIHAEVLTHRDFSRNSRSQRAVPVAKMIGEVWRTPFIPWHWGRNQKGMQAGTSIYGWRRIVARWTWICASKVACVLAWILMHLGLHKQIANRLLSPFLWIDTLITSTRWRNFLELRDHEDAEPHFRDLARLIRLAVARAERRELKPGEWHMPFVTPAERESDLPVDHLLKLSVARCARISYAPFDGNADLEAEFERYRKLVVAKPAHASPAEHQATPADDPNDAAEGGNLGEGWCQNRKRLFPSEKARIAK